MNVKPKSLREPHYADTHERDNKQRSLIGRAVPGDCVGKYRVFCSMICVTLPIFC